MKYDLSGLSHEQLSLLRALIKNHSSDHHGASGEQLLAYYTESAQQEGQNRGAELRGVAQALLPEHMVPDLFVPVAEMPRLANGKVDPDGLPYVVVTRASYADSEGSNARHEFEIVAGLLGELLGFDDIRPDDNFFELGGDSITAIRLVSRVREAGIPIDISAVTSARTLGEIAAEANQRLHAANENSALSKSVGEQVPVDERTSNLEGKSLIGDVDHPDLGLSNSELDSFLDSLD